MTSTGTQQLGSLLSGDYQLLWVATPADWHVRLPGKWAGPHCQRIQTLMPEARALRMTIVHAGPPGYFWKQGPTREAIEDLGLQVMRMRFCHFGLKYDRADALPSGSRLQATTTCARIPTNQMRCTCNTAGTHAQPTEHVLGRRGQCAQKAEWRNKTLAIMTARLIDQMGLHETQRNHISAVHLSIHTRVDKGARNYVQSPKNGPEWGHVVRRVTMHLNDNTVIQDIKIQGQPIGHNYNAPLPNGVTNI
eukprot:4765272-Pyramimonas_sp.AAC.1